MISDCASIWKNCLAVIREQVTQQAYQTWFLPLRPIRLIDHILTVQSPSKFHCEWIEQNHLQALTTAIKKVLGENGKFEYYVSEQRVEKKAPQLASSSPLAQSAMLGGQSLAVLKHTPNKNELLKANQNVTVRTEQVPILAAQTRYFKQFPLNEQYTFDNFVEGNSNKVAKTTAFTAANNLGRTSFNPLLIQGNSGLGKTHLAQAVANHAKANFPDKKCIYTSAERFVTDFIQALKENNIQTLTNLYMDVDLLVVDDIQFLSGKTKTQDIFFHIFNHLHQSRKQIILTSDCPVAALKGLEERLISRFKGGFSATIEVPEQDLRKRYILTRLASEKKNLDSLLVDYIAENFHSNIRELDGLINNILIKADLTKTEITLPFIKNMLNELSPREVQVKMSIEDIQIVVSQYFKISVSDILSTSRRREIVMARHLAMYFAGKYSEHSLSQIGFYFGKRHHSTVIHACDRVTQALKEQENAFVDALAALSPKFGG
ncbi:MAG: chromosomal replication initiator protein DnaA [Cytophagales bacterium]|nr:MAG: chromosomal replication initiator protein DnaA [Cytophagales bacterium]TAF60257.1 MAG: chromosomal replication initiator protein DnaA [Cytophagales bacterium]